MNDLHALLYPCTLAAGIALGFGFGLMFSNIAREIRYWREARRLRGQQ